MKENKWDKQICFRMNEEFFKKMMELAQHEGCGRSNWIRKTLKKAIRREYSRIKREAILQ
jgi:predicted DNA-binding protein